MESLYQLDTVRMVHDLVACIFRQDTPCTACNYCTEVVTGKTGPDRGTRKFNARETRGDRSCLGPRASRATPGIPVPGDRPGLLLTGRAEFRAGCSVRERPRAGQGCPAWAEAVSGQLRPGVLPVCARENPGNPGTDRANRANRGNNRRPLQITSDLVCPLTNARGLSRNPR